MNRLNRMLSYCLLYRMDMKHNALVPEITREYRMFRAIVEATRHCKLKEPMIQKWDDKEEGFIEVRELE